MVIMRTMALSNYGHAFLLSDRILEGLMRGIMISERYANRKMLDRFEIFNFRASIELDLEKNCSSR